MWKIIIEVGQKYFFYQTKMSWNVGLIFQQKLLKYVYTKKVYTTCAKFC